MESCKTCRFYNKKYDELRQKGDDVLIEGESGEKHYCLLYDEPVTEIYEGKKECEYYKKK